VRICGGDAGGGWVTEDPAGNEITDGVEQVSRPSGFGEAYHAGSEDAISATISAAG
jgi:hypothetical protein